MAQRSSEVDSGGTVVIAATFAAEPLEPVLCFWLKTLGLPLEVRFAGYNQVFQELLTPASDFGSNRSGVNVLLIRLEDYARAQHSSSEDVREVLARTVRELSEAVAGFVERSRVPLLIGLLPVSAEATASWTFSSQSLVSELTAQLAGLPRVTLLDPVECSRYAPESCFDPIQDELGHVPYTAEYFAALGSVLARKIHALKVPARKVLVLDCDNTLWKGVVGEDGIEGIGLSAGFLALQRFASEQHAQGTLICLCSKNAEQDVLDVFEKRGEMLLKIDQIVAHRINWQSKTENLLALAEELNLGLDSFVFLDDSAVECGQIREALPQVLTLELPHESELEAFLQHLWVFDKVATTEVDKTRTQLYRDNVARHRFQRQSGSIGDFIRGLNLEIEIDAPQAGDWARLSQLTQRTNQFNFTTIRRTEAELRALLDQGADCVCVRVRDRFGDYGLVGMVVSMPRGEDLWIDTWLLSCRVLGRGVEHAMLRRVGQLASERGLSNVVLELRPTAKNAPARLFADNVASNYKTELEGTVEYRIPRDVALAVEHQPGSAHDQQMAAAAGEGDGAHSSAPPPAIQVAPYDSIARLASARAVNDAVLAARPRRRRASTLGPQPKSELEARLVSVWEELLGVDGIQVEDDFFELGGSSLLAVALFSRLAKEFGARLPLSTIMEAPTVRALARRLDASHSHEANATVIELGLGSGPTALFLIHDGDGEILLYRGLSRLLPPGIAVFGLSPKTLPGVPLAHGSVQEMAAYQVEQVRRLRPHGPYLLGGLCAGGVIAMEMAAQLEQAGEAVALVALFDSASPTAHRKTGLVSARRLDRARELLTSTGASTLPWSERAREVLSTAAVRARNVARYELGQSGRKLSEKVRFRLLRQFLAHDVAWPAWLPSLSVRAIVNQAEALHSPSRVRRARVVLFRAIEAEGQPGFRHLFEEPCFGWSEHVDGEFTAIDVPGDHSTLLQEPHVAAVARELRALVSSTCSETEIEIEQYPELEVASPVSESSMPALSTEELLRAG
jgi:FkbH-like protein